MNNNKKNFWNINILEKKLLIFWCDFLFVFLSLYCMIILRSTITMELFLSRGYFYALLLYSFSAVVVFYVLDLYNVFIIDFWTTLLPRIFVAVCISVMLIILSSFFHEPLALPRKSIIAVTFLLMMGMAVVRYFFMVVHRYPLRIMIAGSGFTTLKIIEDIKNTGSNFIQIEGVYHEKNNPTGVKVMDVDIKGGLKEFLNDIENNPPQVVVVSFKNVVPDEWTDALLKCARYDIKILSATDIYGRLFGKVPSDHIDAIWLLSGISIVRRPYFMIKRFFDVLFSLLGLLILCLLFPFIFIIMKFTSPGPIFFSQIRVGSRGKNFKIYKYRTMVVNAEQSTGAVWCKHKDTRITPLGRFMRKVRLDELPQFWNILKGEMSIIGPRPERPEFVSMLKQRIPFYDERHLVKPGLTGWAQVMFPYGNSVEDAAEKLHFDLFYIMKMSFFMDVKILLKTISIVLEGKGGM